MTRTTARRLLQLRRGAVKGAPAPPYILIAIAVIAGMALFQWYQQRQEDQRAKDEQKPPPAVATKKPAAPKNAPADDSDPPAKPQRPVVLEPSATASNKTGANTTTANKSTSPAQKSPSVSSPSSTNEPRPSGNPNAGQYRVTHVADGDTLNLEGRHRVRLIGIDCPEIAHPEKDPPTKAQPWSNEAMKFTEARIKNQMVRVEFDPDYDAEDRYGRWLCWVYYRDQRDGSEKLLNEELLRQGLAFAYDDRRKFHYSEAMYRRLKAAQREAQDEQRGIYSK